jgi:ABC-type transport system substrate-binding protein
MDELLDVILSSRDTATQKSAYREVETLMNQQNWFIWLPILKVKVPISNRFGNLQPSIMAHRILWNIERVYVKPRES